jgi:predicted DNA-binding protein
METQGYKIRYEKKEKNLYCRMDDSMIQRLKDIRKRTGISISEIMREAIRKLLKEVDETGSINLRLD